MTTKILMWNQEKNSMYMIKASFKIFDNLKQAKLFVKNNKYFSSANFKKEYDLFFKEIDYISEVLQ